MLFFTQAILFAQDNQQNDVPEPPNNGNDIIEMIQILVVLAFIFGPAILQLLFGKKKEVKEVVTPEPLAQEIDEFVKGQKQVPTTAPRAKRSKHTKGTEVKKRRERAIDAAFYEVAPRSESTSLTPIASPISPMIAPQEPEFSFQTPAPRAAVHPIVTMLHHPATLPQAILLGEILKRPDSLRDFR